MKFMFGYKAGKVLSEQEEQMPTPMPTPRPFTEPEDRKVDVGTALSIYTIQPGDNLTKIANEMGVTVDDILKQNPQIKDKNKIFPGDTIQIEN